MFIFIIKNKTFKNKMNTVSEINFLSDTFFHVIKEFILIVIVSESTILK